MAGIESPTWIGERLREEGVISAPVLRLAIQNMGLYNERMEEALLRIGALDEPRLLKFIAEKCRIHYVSTHKLASMHVPRDALDHVPERVAEKLLMFPVRFDADTQTLTLVSPDAGNPEYTKQISIATGIKSLKVYVARPLAVKAAIAKWYRGENQAFSKISLDTFTQMQSAVDMYERQMLDEGGLTRRPPAPPAPVEEYFMTPLPNLSSERRMAPARAATAPVTLDLSEPFLAVPAVAAGKAHAPSERPRRGPFHAKTLVPPNWIPAPDVKPVQLESPRIAQPDVVLHEIVAAPAEGRLTDLAETLNVLVMLSENAREEARGHSASVARMSQLVVKRMGLDETTGVCAQIAANLHDLGKTVAYHLTALNVADYATHRTAAQRLVMTPLRLLENVNLPAAAKSAVAGMYERFDGQGFPGKLAQKEIPLGARLLAICDSYADLTLNAGNPHGRVLGHGEAIDALSSHRGTVFDPDLIDLLKDLMAAEDLRRRLGDSHPLVLVVEPSPEEATLLELRLVAQGFDVRVARTADAALSIALQESVHFVFSEVELVPFDGFELLERLRKSDVTSSIPFIFVARTAETAAIDRGFSLGAQDYVVKPTSGDVLAAKLRRLAGPKSRRDVNSGVAGSLSEMSVADLTQIMAHGRKAGRLRLRSDGREGEVHFNSGRIVHAILGTLEGDSAFYELLAFSKGTFAFEPDFKPALETITGHHESLILEGFRRLDERARKERESG